MTALLAPAVVGRSDELAALRAALDAAADGRGGALLLTGQAGVGKTRLLREVAGWAGARGIGVMVGRAVETATSVPFRPLAEALLAAFRARSPLDDPDVAPFRDTLARLVPGLGPQPAGPAPVLHVAEAFLRVARSGARVVLLDDLHWADEETLAVIEYLADNVAAEPVLLLAASRQVPPRLLAAADRRALHVLAMTHFSAEQVVEMARGCLGDAAVPAEILRLLADRADGLPFFVEELLAGMVHQGALVREDGRWIVRGSERGRAPDTFAESVCRRFARLPATAAQVLLDAALVGRRIDADLLARVSEAAPDVVDAAIGSGIGQGLLEIAEPEVRFRHALTRDALLATLTPPQRRARSARALAALQAARPDLPDDLVEVAADLAEAAGRPADAAALLLEVGRRALAEGALATAEGAQRRALAAAAGGPLVAEVEEALVGTLGLAGRADEAFPLGEVLLARLLVLDPGGVRRREVHLALARAAVAAGDWPLAGAHLAEVRRSAGSDPLVAARLQTLDAMVALGEFRLDDAERLAADAVADAERTGDADLLCEALFVHGRCRRIRDLPASAAIFRRARDVARAAGLVHREARSLTELGVVLAYSSSGGDDSVLQQARRLAQATGALETEAVVRNVLAVAAWFRGDLAALRCHADETIVLARRYRLGMLVASGITLQASAHALRGDRDATEERLTAIETLVGGDPTQLIAVHAQCRAACAFARDEIDLAAAELDRAGEIVLAGHPTLVPPMVGMAVLVRAVHDRPSTPLADHLRERHDCGPPVAAMLELADAVTLGRRGEQVAASALAARARRALAPCPFLHAVAARLVAPVAARDGWGEPGPWLTGAAEVFTARGLPAPARACHGELRRMAAPGELSAREREVLDLIVEGLPNKAVAQRLFLSPRTVEKHVERLLAKTGSANRAQLVTYGLRRTLHDPPDT